MGCSRGEERNDILKFKTQQRYAGAGAKFCRTTEEKGLSLTRRYNTEK
jgi:hypothetical protein